MANFWSDATQQDPKRQYRWIMRIASVPTYVLKKTDKPSFQVTETEHKYLNHTYYYPGRVQWQEINVTLADPINPDMAATITNIIKDGGYLPAQNTNDTSTMSKQKSVAALGNLVEIQQIDADGNAVETWKLVNPWIKDVKYGELSYDGDDMTEITLILRYDWAELETANAGHTKNERKFFELG